jgi:hypothetical protein
VIKPEQIPDEVVEAAHRAALEADFNMRDQLRAAIVAAINAWPDAFITKYSEGAPAFNLPLTQEKSNGSD